MLDELHKLLNDGVHTLECSMLDNFNADQAMLVPAVVNEVLAQASVTATVMLFALCLLDRGVVPFSCGGVSRNHPSPSHHAIIPVTLCYVMLCSGQLGVVFGLVG